MHAMRGKNALCINVMEVVHIVTAVTDYVVKLQPF
jgi:hypothetical protein